jgi:hypothetical protein
MINPTRESVEKEDRIKIETPLIIPVVQALIKNRQEKSVTTRFLSSLKSQREKTPLKRREPAFMQRHSDQVIGHKIKAHVQRLAF